LEVATPAVSNQDKVESFESFETDIVLNSRRTLGARPNDIDQRLGLLGQVH
jgi:hypothetical protein